MIRSHYHCCCINKHLIFSHWVHFKLGQRFHALLKVCSDRHDTAPLNLILWEQDRCGFSLPHKKWRHWAFWMFPQTFPHRTFFPKQIRDVFLQDAGHEERLEAELPSFTWTSSRNELIIIATQHSSDIAAVRLHGTYYTTERPQQGKYQAAFYICTACGTT